MEVKVHFRGGVCSVRVITYYGAVYSVCLAIGGSRNQSSTILVPFVED